MTRGALTNNKVVTGLREMNDGTSIGLARDRIAQAYMGLWGGASTIDKARRRIHWITSRVVGANVLDVGTSEGIVPILLGREGFHAVGIDINPEAIAYADQLLEQEAEAIRERVQFRNVSLFQDETDTLFDTVILGEVIEHVSNIRKFIETAVFHLADGGVLILTTPFGVFPDRDHKHTFYLSDVRDLLTSHGDIEHLEVVDGYIRTVLRKVLKDSSGVDAKEKKGLLLNENLLSLTEEASHAIQVNLYKHIDDARQSKEKLLNELDQAQSAISSLNESLVQKSEALAAALKEISTTREQLASVTEALLIKQEKVEELQQIVEAREADLRTAKSDLSDVQLSRGSQIEEVKNLKRKLIQAGKRLASAERKVAHRVAGLKHRPRTSKKNLRVMRDLLQQEPKASNELPFLRKKKLR